MIPNSVALEAAFDKFTEYWSPKVIGQVNDQLLKVAKLKGEFVWHAHDEQDEFFDIVKGSLRIDFENGSVELAQRDLLTVPRGVRDNPAASEECRLLLIEPDSTKHTGDLLTPHTRTSPNAQSIPRLRHTSGPAFQHPQRAKLRLKLSDIVREPLYLV